MKTENSIREFIRENFLYGREKPIASDESLLDAGIIDSTGAMELVTFLEEQFGIEVTDADLVPENLDTISAITAFVTRKLGSQSEREPAPARQAA